MALSFRLARIKGATLHGGSRFALRFLGGQPKQNKVLVKNQSREPTTPLAMENLSQGVVVNVADDGKGIELQLQ